MQTIPLPLADYLPDLPDLGPGSDNIRNVYPRTSLSYGSIGSPSSILNSLNARCQGGTGAMDKLGNVFIFAGDVNDLYLFKVGLSAWQNASKAPGAYSVDPTEMWQYVHFNDEVIAANFGGVPQYFNLTTSSKFADLDGGPPQGRYLGVVKNAFVVLANTYDTTNGNMPQRVRWCAAGNAHSWPTPGTAAAAQVQAGATDLLGGGGWVRGIATDLINADAIIFQDFAIRRMVYTGPPTVFSFLPVENARGTQAPNSIIVDGGVAYYWASDGIKAFDGGASQDIGADKVDKMLFTPRGTHTSDAVDMGNIHRVVGASDPLNQMIWWIYPTVAGGGTPDRLLGYNHNLQKWTISDINAEYIFRLLSIGYTLDQLFTIFGYTVDTVPAPFDSRLWTGGTLQLGMFDTTHKLSFFTGTPLEATVETSEAEMVPGRRVLISNTRPMVDGTDLVAQVSIGYRDKLQDAITYTAAQTQNQLGTCPVRASGRYIRVRTVMPVGSNTWKDISGVEVNMTPQGIR